MEPTIRCIFPDCGEPPIRFELQRYNRRVGSILLCGVHFRRTNPLDPDPLHAEDAA